MGVEIIPTCSHSPLLLGIRDHKLELIMNSIKPLNNNKKE